jgi:hypothetical protein
MCAGAVQYNQSKIFTDLSLIFKNIETTPIIYQLQTLKSVQTETLALSSGNR